MLQWHIDAPKRVSKSTIEGYGCFMSINRRDFTGERKFALCLIMVFMIVVTGMCCRIGQADSLFCAVTEQESQQILTSGESLTDASEVCTQELLRRDSSALFSNSRMVRIRTNLRIVLLFIIAGGTLQCLKHILAAVSEEVYWQIHSNTVILSYIHHQDGKKR